MKVLLTGASGFIGSQILSELLLQGCQVRCVGRKRPPRFSSLQRSLPHGQIEWHDLDYKHATSPEDWSALLEGTDAVVNAVGIIRETKKQNFSIIHSEAPVALFSACLKKNTTIRRVVQISALGVEDGAVTAYFQSKRKADRFLEMSGLDFTIFKPSIVYGPRDASLSLFRGLSALPLTPLIAGGSQKIAPIHVSDLARVWFPSCFRGKKAMHFWGNWAFPAILLFSPFTERLFWR